MTTEALEERHPRQSPSDARACAVDALLAYRKYSRKQAVEIAGLVLEAAEHDQTIAMVQQASYQREQAERELAKAQGHIQQLRGSLDETARGSRDVLERLHAARKALAALLCERGLSHDVAQKILATDFSALAGWEFEEGEAAAPLGWMR